MTVPLGRLVVPLIEKRIERLEHERLVLHRGGLSHLIALV